MHVEDVRSLLDEVFEEEAFAIGGLAATDGIGDASLERLMGSLAVIRRRTLRKLEGRDEEGAAVERSPIGPHPAIERFLAQLGRA